MSVIEKHINKTSTHIALNEMLQKPKHKCKNCPWGTFVGDNRYLCMLPKCNRDLVRNTGVD